MSGKTVATSVRLPEDVHRAATEAVKNGLAGSLTELVVDGLRDRLVAFAMEHQDYADKAAVRAALEEHFELYPGARPSLAEVALAGAEIEDHPAQHHPDLIEKAIADLGDEADVEDILAWVRGALSTRASAVA